MAFDWMSSPVPTHIHESGAARFKAMQAQDVRERAALLRRLGHSRAYAEFRCRRNVAWAFEVAGKSLLSDADLKAVVGEVYR